MLQFLSDPVLKPELRGIWFTVIKNKRLFALISSLSVADLYRLRRASRKVNAHSCLYWGSLLGLHCVRTQGLSSSAARERKPATLNWTDSIHKHVQCTCTSRHAFGAVLESGIICSGFFRQAEVAERTRSSAPTFSNAELGTLRDKG